MTDLSPKPSMVGVLILRNKYSWPIIGPVEDRFAASVITISPVTVEEVIPSYKVKDGDQISLVDKFKQIPSVILAVQSKDREVPEYLTVDYIKMKGVFVKSPTLKDVPYPVEMEPNLVVEFYSR